MFIMMHDVFPARLGAIRHSAAGMLDACINQDCTAFVPLHLIVLTFDPPPAQFGWASARTAVFAWSASGQKRTFPVVSAMSALCYERTHALQQMAPYSITSSARESSVGGKVRPSALAVLRLIASSYLVGACTGRSAGFSPFRMRST